MVEAITVWKRLRHDVYEFNHISDGYVESQKSPVPVSEYQEKMWANAVWAKQKACLIDGEAELTN